MEIENRFREINIWKRGDQRAPNKPLLILLALEKLQNGADRLISFEKN